MSTEEEKLKKENARLREVIGHVIDYIAKTHDVANRPVLLDIRKTLERAIKR